ncbi:glycosyltransferase family 2 protein [Rahnella woolbedingensis]|uniref:Glycosyltransferase family 2 protein n=1 Tax=Rahnella woolbedingensis TaxID=1510574 RepID=A0A419N1Z8_9GAMM|nr:glycosyltransferase family 2 protein [Rahnella woolbedingensis]RJT32050.1 glycosyltransferase family 2 protein [Rahnella woolbedingensis]
MDLQDFSSILKFNLEQNNINKYMTNVWVYKNECCVVDFNIDGNKFAFDVKVGDGFSYVAYVDRQNDNNKKKLLECDFFSIEEICKTIVEKTSSIETKEMAEYSYDISVIIPVYNREFLIGKCIDSLNAQTLNRDHFEVVFVDDFSKDNGISVIKSLIKDDINYRVLKRPINSGSASSPRNDGIKASKGRYVLFLDSDDFILPYCLEELLNCVKRTDPDIVYLKIDGDKGRKFGIRPFAKGNVDRASISGNHLVRSLMPSKLVKKSLIIENNIFFPIDIKVGEDRVFMIHALSKSRRISILADKPYYYLTNHEQERMTNAVQSLEQDFEIVSRGFKHIYLSGKSVSEKQSFFSSWMNVVVEAYVKNRIKSKKNTIIAKSEYISLLIRDFAFYADLHSDEQIYPEFKELYKIFSLGNVDDIVTYCLKS